MKRALRLCALGLATAAIGVSLHYGAVVLAARRTTPAMIDGLLTSERMVLELEDFDAARLDMLLGIEDPAFFEHGGIDLHTAGAGITTITQGMVKYLYFERFRPGIAKLRQSLIAVFALDPLVPKRDQLRIFVNTAYLGHHEGERVTGFARASVIYFGKPFEGLSRGEYLALVAMLVGPNAFHVVREPAANAERVRRIEAVLGGDYRPEGLMDVYYAGLARPFVETEPRER